VISKGIHHSPGFVVTGLKNHFLGKASGDYFVSLTRFGATLTGSRSETI
jgi:hypothetical protein